MRHHNIDHHITYFYVFKNVKGPRFFASSMLQIFPIFMRQVGKKEPENCPSATSHFWSTISMRRLPHFSALMFKISLTTYFWNKHNCTFFKILFLNCFNATFVSIRNKVTLSTVIFFKNAHVGCTVPIIQIYRWMT